MGVSGSRNRRGSEEEGSTRDLELRDRSRERLSRYPGHRRFLLIYPSLLQLVTAPNIPRGHTLPCLWPSRTLSLQQDLHGLESPTRAAIADDIGPFGSEPCDATRWGRDIVDLPIASMAVREKSIPGAASPCKVELETDRRWRPLPAPSRTDSSWPCPAAVEASHCIKLPLLGVLSAGPRWIGGA